MTETSLSRRRFLRAGGAALTSVGLGGCKVLDGLSDPDHGLRQVMERANDLTMALQRGALDRQALAKEYTGADIRQPMRPNGVTAPQDEAYLAHQAAGFAAYRLSVGGLVQSPLSLTLQDLQRLPTRTQITRHDCVEGWSCVAQWTGVPLGRVLELAGLRAEGRYVLIHCFDTIERSLSGAVTYYETIDLVDAYHPQTLLAWGMNGGPLPVPNGAPLRLRVERQLGYKMAKYIRGIEIIDDFAEIGRGKGGYWEDRGYAWYAGI